MDKKADGIGSILKDVFGVGKDVYGGLSNLLWVSAPTAAVAAILGGVRALRPEAVADNADKLLLNENLKASLAQSIRSRENILKQNDAINSYNNVRRHDRFI